MISPLLPPHSADPWIVFQDGFYYYSESRNDQRSIVVRRSRTIAGIAEDIGVYVWHAPPKGGNSHALWAPELHWAGGRWLIYYAADDGHNENHRMWVLESESRNPQGNYRCRGAIDTGGWAIDGTLLRYGRCTYLVWSGWPGNQNGRQNLYIAPLLDDVTLATPRVLLCMPDQEWERRGMPICEGPQVLERNGRLFIVYSASGSWTADYCLGMLMHRGGDVLDPNSWEKCGPVFQQTQEVWGVGHCSFVKSPCQTQEWILYHSKSSRKHGWEDRDVHAKQFHWTAAGLPDFGEPVRRTPRVRWPVREHDNAMPLTLQVV